MKNKAKIKVAVVMGSQSDWQAMEPAIKTLTSFGVCCEVRILSAHRTPVEAARYAASAEARGIQILLAAAGHAAHLAGVLASHTTLPVIGVPMKGGALDGLDALLSMVQMPSGIPVATVALGQAGPINAAVLAVEILALSNAGLRRMLKKHKAALRRKALDADRDLQSKLEKANDQA